MDDIGSECFAFTTILYLTKWLSRYDTKALHHLITYCIIFQSPKFAEFLFRLKVELREITMFH
jgi:hypothetical protein